MTATLQVLYPTGDGTTFDYDYYTATHFGIVETQLGPCSARAGLAQGSAQRMRTVGAVMVKHPGAPESGQDREILVHVGDLGPQNLDLEPGRSGDIADQEVYAEARAEPAPEALCVGLRPLDGLGMRRHVLLPGLGWRTDHR